MSLAETYRLSRLQESDAPNRRAVACWLLVCCLVVLALVVVGGVTRLTESGLSIMEWAPLTGALPPLSEAEWQRVFDLYRAIPQYHALNAGMSLEEFKGIFWWEWWHRQLGRTVGAVYGLPFLWFLIRRRIPPGYLPHLVTLFLLGGAQGAIGWFMVSSGFFEPVSVSQYRLVLHLGLAFVIYSYMFWLALTLLRPHPDPVPQEAAATLRPRLIALVALAGVTMAFGGFVAGLDGGFIYNSFPLMNGHLLPEEFLTHQPAWLDPFETPATAQFVHRWLAVALVIATLAVWLGGRRLALPAGLRRALDLLALMALIQAGLGIATLLLVVPIPVAAAHQAGAVLLLSALLWALSHVRTGKAADA